MNKVMIRFYKVLYLHKQC